MKSGDRVLTGLVASRACPVCGHHEIGLATADGGFHPLKPGMAIRIMEPSGMIHSPGEETLNREVPAQEDPAEHPPWMPDPAMSHRTLRLKYGVRVRSALIGEAMSPEIYRAAYIDKLKDLIEKEIYIPLPVILDRFFTAPHIASGNPRQIAEAMWRELREVREPVRRVEEWLQRRDPSIFAEEAGYADSRGGNAGEVPGTEAVLKELEELSLEDFLGLL